MPTGHLRAWLFAMAAALLPAPPAQAQSSPALAEAGDLAADARLAASRGVPLVLLYSREDCNWCAKLRREYLDPMARDPKTPAVLREVHIDRGTPLIDFAGRRTTSTDFAAGLQVRLAPTVMFHGPGGEALAEAIVGFRLADFYGAYLDRAIEESRERLKARR